MTTTGLLFLATFLVGGAIGAVCGIWLAEEWYTEMTDEEILEQINKEREKRV